MLRRKSLVLTGIIAALFLLFSLTGCSKQPESPDGEDANAGFFEIKGSDSEVNLVTALVESFSAVNDQAEFSITGGGSGTGIAALINGTTHIANSSREMTDDEIKQAKANGVEPIPIVFAYDGLAVIVNDNNPVDDLTVEQIGDIFAGKITNWSDVGGDDMSISLYGRQTTSGTFVFFREKVVKGDYSPAMQMMPGTSQIVEGVKQDVTGIGYSAIGYVKNSTGIKAVSVSEKAGEQYISPLDDEKVFSGEYALTRPLFQYLNGKPEGALKQFIEFELSDEGLEIVLKEGFLPVTDEYRKKNLQYLK